jgi:hypothetical protein
MIDFAATPGAAETFWTTNKDLLALLVSLTALAVSIIAARQNIRATRKIAEDAAENAQLMARTATYQRIHELLVDSKAASGRRRLFQAARTKRYPALGEEGWDEINYSLALYDTLAGYVARAQVDEVVALDAWHHPLANIAPAVRAFMSHRQAENVTQPWAHLLGLLEKSELYTCNCPGLAEQEKAAEAPPRDPRASTGTVA